MRKQGQKKVRLCMHMRKQGQREIPPQLAGMSTGEASQATSLKHKQEKRCTGAQDNQPRRRGACVHARPPENYLVPVQAGLLPPTTSSLLWARFRRRHFLQSSRRQLRMADSSELGLAYHPGRWVRTRTHAKIVQSDEDDTERNMHLRPQLPPPPPPPRSRVIMDKDGRNGME